MPSKAAHPNPLSLETEPPPPGASVWETDIGEGHRPFSTWEDPYLVSVPCAFGADLDSLGIVCDCYRAATGVWRLQCWRGCSRDR